MLSTLKGIAAHCRKRGGTVTTDLSTILHHSPDGSSVSGRTSHACAIFERRSSCPRSQPCDTAQGSQFLAHDSRIDAPSHMAISHIDETMFHRTTQTRTGRFQASSSVSNSRFTCVRPSCSITSETSLQPAHAFSAANFTSRLPFHPYKLPPPQSLTTSFFLPSAHQIATFRRLVSRSEGLVAVPAPEAIVSRSCAFVYEGQSFGQLFRRPEKKLQKKVKMGRYKRASGVSVGGHWLGRFLFIACLAVRWEGKKSGHRRLPCLSRATWSTHVD